MTAIGDVARLAGVSKATASRALSGRGYVAEETRRRVEVAAAEIGYIASPNAASLVTGRTKNVGVVIPFVNRWFFGEVLEGIERALLAAGYDLTLYNVGSAGQDRDRVFDFFLARKRVDAVIAVGVELTERRDGRAPSPRQARRGHRRQRSRARRTLSIDDRRGRRPRHRAPAAPRPHPDRAHRRRGRVHELDVRARMSPRGLPRGDGGGGAPSEADAHSSRPR